MSMSVVPCNQRVGWVLLVVLLFCSNKEGKTVNSFSVCVLHLVENRCVKGVLKCFSALSYRRKDGWGLAMKEIFEIGNSNL